MQLHIASDLHLEFLLERFPGERLIEPAPGADILVLAGDIANGMQAIQLFGDWPVPVLYIAGNHEFYGHALDVTRQALRAAAHSTSIRFLDNDAFEWGSVRFLGTTLWTDYRLRTNRTQTQLLDLADLSINDHRLISSQGGAFTPRHALAEHEASRAWLEQELNAPFAGRTVVISHHGPHPLSSHPRYAGNSLNAAFVSDLSALFPGVDLWVHGHVHDSCDYTLGRCRVVANPLGYPRGMSTASSLADLAFENRDFGWAFTVDLG